MKAPASTSSRSAGTTIENRTGEDFKRLYHEVVRHLGRHKRRAYAVQLRPRDLDVKYWEQKNVQVINVDATEFLKEIEQRLRSW
jgi:hypothetical protein